MARRTFKMGQQVRGRTTGARGVVTRGGRKPVVKGRVKGKPFQKTVIGEFFDIIEE